MKTREQILDLAVRLVAQKMQPWPLTRKFLENRSKYGMSEKFIEAVRKEFEQLKHIEMRADWFANQGLPRDWA